MGTPPNGGWILPVASDWTGLFKSNSEATPEIPEDPETRFERTCSQVGGAGAGGTEGASETTGARCVVERGAEEAGFGGAETDCETAGRRAVEGDTRGVAFRVAFGGMGTMASAKFGYGNAGAGEAEGDGEMTGASCCVR